MVGLPWCAMVLYNLHEAFLVNLLISHIMRLVTYRNSRVFGDKFVTEFGESLNLVRCSVKISVTILVVHQNR